MEVLFITRQDLVKFTATNGNVDTDNFIQWIKVAQDIHLQNYLGTRLFNKLKTDIKNNTGTVTSATLNAPGTGYAAGTYPTTGGSGTGCTITITGTSGGGILTFTIGAAGTGYKVGDILTLNGLPLAPGTGGSVEVTGDGVPVNYRTLLNTYVKPCLIHWAMVEYLPFAAYTIANKGIFKHTSENANTIEKAELDLLIDKQRQIAQHYTERMIDYLIFNNNLFPEYNQNSNGDMYPDTNNYNIGWVL